MKYINKFLAILLALSLMMTLVSCGNSDADSDSSGVADDSSQTVSVPTDTDDSQMDPTDATSEDAGKTESTTAGKKNTTTQKTTSKKTTKKVTQPVKLNPKTDFKFGKYVTTFYDNNKQSYHEVSLNFYKEFEGLEYQKLNFYTKEQCKKRSEAMGMEFSEDSFFYEYEKVIDGVTYYNVGDNEILPERYEMTSKSIKLTPELECMGELSLNADGTLTADVSKEGRYGAAGSIFKFVNE